MPCQRLKFSDLSFLPAKWQLLRSPHLERLNRLHLSHCPSGILLNRLRGHPLYILLKTSIRPLVQQSRYRPPLILQSPALSPSPSGQAESQRDSAAHIVPVEIGVALNFPCCRTGILQVPLLLKAVHGLLSVLEQLGQCLFLLLIRQPHNLLLGKRSLGQ